MGFIDTITPAVIFALLAILFAVLNFLLWLMVWKNTETSSSSAQTIDMDVVNKLMKKMSDETEKTAKTEDQLWGVLDKIEEIKQSISSLEKDKKEISSPEINKNVLKLIDEGNRKITAFLREYLKEVRNSKSLLENLDKKLENVEKLSEVFEAIDVSIAEVNSRLKKLENVEKLSEVFETIDGSIAEVNSRLKKMDK